MKTINKYFQQAGNITLVQVETLEGEGFGFLPAAPALDRGDLVIKELRQEGSVNILLAINPSDHYYLLTDMDLLKGARQNRVVNTSVLIAPRTKRQVDVSCVERSRWSYNSPTFKPGPEILDLKMRAAKAGSLRKDMKKHSRNTQMKIWDLINDELLSHHFISETEDYSSMLESNIKSTADARTFKLEAGCNGMAVFEGKRVISFDLFGNRVGCKHYFEKLAGTARQQATGTSSMDTPGKAEAFYRLDELLDRFESLLEVPAGQREDETGTLRWSGDREYAGFLLDFKGELVHMTGMAG